MAVTLPAWDGVAEASQETLTELRTALRGEALTPDDPGYEQRSIPFNAMHPDRPGLLIRCRGTADVVEAVNFARRTGAEMTVRGGGHSVAGLSSSVGGLVVDLSEMR